MFRKNIKENSKKDSIAQFIIIMSALILFIITGYYIKCSNDPEQLFNLLLPLISTWIGTLLAFYFGRENFEAATKSYDQLINKLSPEILDDILIRQVMIDKYTMVSLDVNNKLISNFDVKNLRDFLDGINKTRLPILESNKVKYVIHKSTLSDELLKEKPATSMTEFANNNKKITDFFILNENKNVEEARKIMNEKNFKDLFVVDNNDLMVGWLTDTQIIRYMDTQKI